MWMLVSRTDILLLWWWCVKHKVQVGKRLSGNEHQIRLISQTRWDSSKWTWCTSESRLVLLPPCCTGSLKELWEREWGPVGDQRVPMQDLTQLSVAINSLHFKPCSGQPFKALIMNISGWMCCYKSCSVVRVRQQSVTHTCKVLCMININAFLS